MSPQRRTEWQIALWSIFAACFTGAGALPLSDIHHQRFVSDQGPYNSIDATLRDEIGFENGTAKLASALANVPNDTPISVVYRHSGFLVLPGVITTQVLSSRPVQEFRCSTPYGSDLDTGRLRKRGGVAIFLAMPPPQNLGETTQVGSHVFMVKIAPSS
jgi:hypothetical protein